MFCCCFSPFLCTDSKSSECQMRNLEGFCRNTKIQMAAKPIECTGTKIKHASISLKCMSKYSYGPMGHEKYNLFAHTTNG